jgi:hypothetical protein
VFLTEVGHAAGSRESKEPLVRSRSKLGREQENEDVCCSITYRPAIAISGFWPSAMRGT